MSRRTSAVNWVQLSNWREEEQMNLPLMDLMLERVKSLDFVSVGMFILSNNTLISDDNSGRYRDTAGGGEM
ncbi:unnamed protein product [Brassica oleracea]